MTSIHGVFVEEPNPMTWLFAVMPVVASNGSIQSVLVYMEIVKVGAALTVLEEVQQIIQDTIFNLLVLTVPLLEPSLQCLLIYWCFGVLNHFQANTFQNSLLITENSLDLSTETPTRTEWCICGGPEEGEMIACDNPGCVTEWFHFECVGLISAPFGKWFCQNCKLRAPTD